MKKLFKHKTEAEKAFLVGLRKGGLSLRDAANYCQEIYASPSNILAYEKVFCIKNFILLAIR